MCKQSWHSWEDKTDYLITAVKAQWPHDCLCRFGHPLVLSVTKIFQNLMTRVTCNLVCNDEKTIDFDSAVTFSPVPHSDQTCHFLMSVPFKPNSHHSSG